MVRNGTRYSEDDGSSIIDALKNLIVDHGLRETLLALSDRTGDWMDDQKRLGYEKLGTPEERLAGTIVARRTTIFKFG